MQENDITYPNIKQPKKLKTCFRDTRSFPIARTQVLYS